MKLILLLSFISPKFHNDYQSKDQNDCSPKFIKEVFTGGVTTESSFGTVFMTVKVSVSFN